MKNTIQKPLLLSIVTMAMFNACSSHDVVATTPVHLYNHNFGIVENLQADAIIHQEYLAMNDPTEIEMPIITDPELSTRLIIDPDAFLAEEYVQTPEVISYKYKFDPKFYSKAEWRTMDLQ